jgi:endonuclease/exonuclease/phosphatase family metal-dependent hydrolase
MDPFRVMTWNVENLFAPAPGVSRDRFNRKLAHLAALIDGAAPTVLALQEVGGADALAALQERLGRPMPHAALADADGRGIRCAVLSTLPIEAQSQIRSFPPLIRPVQNRDPIFDDPATPLDDESLTASLGRPALEVTVRVADEPVTIINAHLKSKLISYARRRGLVGGSQFQPSDENERYRYAAYALYRRTAEAVALRDRANALLAGGGEQRALVVCGDLNDGVDAATTQVLQGPPGSAIGTAGFASADRGDGDRLWNLAPLLNRQADGSAPNEPPFTRRFRDRGELIDHIFASRRLVNPVNPPVVQTLGAERLMSINERPGERSENLFPDHAAVLASFALT